MNLSIPGKWILAGEHAVVRGASALVFPLPSRTLNLSFEAAASFSVHSSDSSLEEAARQAFAKACEMLGVRELSVAAEFSSTIPVGAGLGSSAALCVAVGKVFVNTGALAEARLAEFSRELENVFHGKSSGLDITAVLEAKPLEFSRAEGARPLIVKRKPELYLVDTGVRSSTKDCVRKVEALARPDLDQRMSEAVELAKAALSGNGDLAEALRVGQSCYEEWGLVPQKVSEKILALEKSGALACKLTGSGDGGFLLTLWKEKPTIPALPCF